MSHLSGKCSKPECYDRRIEGRRASSSGEREILPGAIAAYLLKKEKEYGKEFKRHSYLPDKQASTSREQRSWLKYQDSTCKLQEMQMTFEGWNIAHVSAAGCLLRTTLERLQELRWMVDCLNRVRC
jgi:Lysozyme inhibitor LprI